MIAGPEVGSRIPRVAQAMRFRPAPKALEDPSGTHQAQRRRNEAAWKFKEKKELRERIRHGVYGQ